MWHIRPKVEKQDYKEGLDMPVETVDLNIFKKLCILLNIPL